jgi:hypothetical protein
MGNRSRSNSAASASLVGDKHGLMKRRCERFRKNRSQEIGATAHRERIHELHWTIRARHGRCLYLDHHVAAGNKYASSPTTVVSWFLCVQGETAIHLVLSDRFLISPASTVSGAVLGATQLLAILGGTLRLQKLDIQVSL